MFVFGIVLSIITGFLFVCDIIGIGLKMGQKENPMSMLLSAIVTGAMLTYIILSLVL